MSIVVKFEHKKMAFIRHLKGIIFIGGTASSYEGTIGEVERIKIKPLLIIRFLFSVIFKLYIKE